MSKKSSMARVQAALDGFGLDLEAVELPGSTRTAKDAAQAIGCEVAQIAKSIIFRAKESDQPVLVVASGVNRIDEKLIGQLIGQKIGQAKPDWVRERTGYAIGGVPPVGHPEEVITILDADLLKLERIWAAAGTPRSVFGLTPDDLVKITGGRVEKVN